MPAERQPLAWRKWYSPQDMAVIERGLIPHEMEDKWFIFHEDGRLYVHRSWTGLCCYEVAWERGAISEAWYNPKVEYTVDQHAAMLEWLIECLLLGRPVAFPEILVPGDLSARDASALRHHVAGYASPAAPREPLSADKACIELSREPLERCRCEFLAYGGKSSGELGGGPGAAILAAAGEQYHDALRERLASSDRVAGTVVVLPAFKMKAAGVLGIFHMITLTQDLRGAWVSDSGALSKALGRMFEMCRELKAHSVAVAPVGATKGNIGPTGSAELMIRAAKDYGRQHPDWPLRIVFSLRDYQLYQTFQRRL
jgi:O-acetyl-ADP-ribose deacetylase (regulator of RNase III)